MKRVVLEDEGGRTVKSSLKRTVFEDEGGKAMGSSLKRAVFEDDGSGMVQGWFRDETWL